MNQFLDIQGRLVRVGDRVKTLLGKEFTIISIDKDGYAKVGAFQPMSGTYDMEVSTRYVGHLERMNWHASENVQIGQAKP